jgi:hypothetical protein
MAELRETENYFERASQEHPEFGEALVDLIYAIRRMVSVTRTIVMDERFFDMNFVVWDYLKKTTARLFDSNERTEQCIRGPLKDVDAEDDC